MKSAAPYLSVIIPAHQSGGTLRQALEALAASDLPREWWELIVVDDASTDETPLVAAQYADTVVRLAGRPHGPAYARNRGFEVSRGEVIVFLDADVSVHRDTLRRFVHVFTTEPTVSAAFGSYDAQPSAPGLVSQYRNLLHHYVHQQSAGEAETFWAGCGAVRRQVFVDTGMYDEWHFSRPQVEDIELGHRMRDLGHRIVLLPDVQVTHLKAWTLWRVVKGDFNNRGVPWMRLLIQQGATVRVRALNLRTVEKANTALVVVATLCAAGALSRRDPAMWLTCAAIALVFVLAINLRLYAFYRRQRGLRFTLAVVPLHILYYLNNAVAVAYAWLLHHIVGEPAPEPIVQAYAEVGVKMWPPVPNRMRSGAWAATARRAD